MNVSVLTNPFNKLEESLLQLWQIQQGQWVTVWQGKALIGLQAMIGLKAMIGLGYHKKQTIKSIPGVPKHVLH